MNTRVNSPVPGAHACGFGALLTAWELACAPFRAVADTQAALDDAVGASYLHAGSLGVRGLICYGSGGCGQGLFEHG